jgi:hypothetical protein
LNGFVKVNLTAFAMPMVFAKQLEWLPANQGDDKQQS